MAHLADRVKDTSTTTGTGTLTLSGASSSTFLPFSSLPDGTEVEYAIQHQAANEFEVGRGFVGASDTLTRAQVLRSSNSDALVSFSAGTKDVFVTVAAQSIFTTGLAAAMPYAMR